jgi:hypothetical protein
LGMEECLLKGLYARNENLQLLTSPRHIMCPQVHRLFSWPPWCLEVSRDL